MDPGRLVSVVDDEQSLRDALRGLFRSAGLPVAAFASSEAFLRSRHLRKTRCLVLDLQMPGMGGLTLQRRLAHDGYDIPTIVLTAHGDDDALAAAMRSGAVAFLPKPFDGGVLLGVVESALERNRP